MGRVLFSLALSVLISAMVNPTAYAGLTDTPISPNGESVIYAKFGPIAVKAISF
jgi:hypothetical protein